MSCAVNAFPRARRSRNRIPRIRPPDPQWQEALTFAARTAESAIADLTERYQAAVEGLPVMERIPDYDEIEIAS